MKSECGLAAINQLYAVFANVFKLLQLLWGAISVYLIHTRIVEMKIYISLISDKFKVAIVHILTCDVQSEQLVSTLLWCMYGFEVLS